MSLLERVRCALFGDACPPPWAEDDDELLAELRGHTERANRAADALRAARLAGAGDPAARDAALADLPGDPPWRPGDRP